MYEADCSHVVPKEDVRKCYGCYGKVCKECMFDETCCAMCSEEIDSIEAFRGALERGATALKGMEDNSLQYLALQAELDRAHIFIDTVKASDPVIFRGQVTLDIMSDCGETIQILQEELEGRIFNIIQGIDNEPPSFDVMPKTL